MPEQRVSGPCKVCETSSEAREHGKFGLWYSYNNDRRQFPDDVASVFIVMPVEGWGGNGIVCEWTVDRKNQCNAQWKLSGTKEKPTLSPSLHWVGMWHGWLTDGELKSC